MTRRPLSALHAAAAAVGLLLLTSAGHAAIDPTAFVNELGTEGIQMLGPAVPPAQRAARFRQLFEADFDVSGIGRFVAGRYWRAFNPQQQQEFLRLFADYTATAYAEKLGQYGGAQFRTIGAQPSSDGIVVMSAVQGANGKPVQIDWHVTQAGGQPKISDVLVDRVSMKVTQRDEFASIIQNNGGRPEALLAVMRQKLRESGSMPSASAR